MAVTAFAMQADRERAFENGFDGFVEKPISVRGAAGAGTPLPRGRGVERDEQAQVIGPTGHRPRRRRPDRRTSGCSMRCSRRAATDVRARRLRSRRPSSCSPQSDPDLVLLDIVMPEMDGYAVCRAIREDPDDGVPPGRDDHRQRWSGAAEGAGGGCGRLRLQAVRPSELLARVASLARLKRYQDTILRQAEELAAWNHELEARVQRRCGRARADRQAAPLPPTPARRDRRELG